MTEKVSSWRINGARLISGQRLLWRLSLFSGGASRTFDFCA